MSKHECTDSCFQYRNSTKLKIDCFSCGHLCSLRCYNLTSQPIIDALKSPSNAVFLCNLCREKVPSIRHNRKSGVSRLSNSSSSTQPAPSVVEEKNYMTKADYANLLTLHDNLNGQMNSINEISNKIHDFVIASNNINPDNNHQQSGAHNRTDDDYYKSSKTTIENIFNLMLKFQPKIESLHTTNDEKKSIQQIMNAIETKYTNTTIKPMNATLSHCPMDNWSMTNNDSINESLLGAVGRPSLLIRQSVDDDIMQVLKNSERITWDTLDLLNKAVDGQNGKLDSILSHMGIGPNAISSPLFDTIQMSNSNSPTTGFDHTNIHMREHIDDVEIIAQSSPTSLAGNPPTMNKQKEAIAQINTTNVPESLKYNMQKRQQPNSSGGWPGIECSVTGAQSTIPPTDDINQNDMCTTNSLTESKRNDFREINDKIDKLYDDLISKLPIRLPLAGHTLNRGFNIAPVIDVSDETESLQHENQLDTSTADRSTPLDITEHFSNSILVQEMFNGVTNSDNVSTSQHVAENTMPPTNQNERRNEFHLSNVSKDTTKEMIIDYMKLRGIHDESHIKLTCLVPRNRDISTLSYLSYKIDTNDDIASIIQEHNFWPPKTKFKKFVQIRPSTAEFSIREPPNFQSERCPSNVNRRTE